MTNGCIDVICPVFREADGIAEFHRRLTGVLDHETAYVWRIIYVVDPSGDGTEAVLEQIARQDLRVNVIVMSRRFGHQLCLVAGLDASRADAALMLDSDQQHPPELIPTLIREWERGADIVQMLRADNASASLAKRFTSRLFYSLFARLGALDLPAGSADFRLLARPVIELFQTRVREQNPFLRGLVHWVGFNVRYIEFEPENRRHGRSSYRPLLLLAFALNGWCSFSKTPLRVCVISGIALALLSAFVTIVQTAAYLVGREYVPGWLTLMIGPAFFGGVQLIFLGVIGEYVGLIFDEVKQRPRYIVQAHHGLQPGRAKDMPAVPSTSETLS